MTLRTRLQKLQENGDLLTITAPISKKHEIAAVLKQLEPRPVLFENVKEFEFRVIGNLFCNKAQFADYFGIEVAEIIPTVTEAINSPPSALTPCPSPLGRGGASSLPGSNASET